MNNVSIIGRLDKKPKLLKSRSGRDILRFIIKIDRPYCSDDNLFQKVDYIPCFATDHKAVDIYSRLQPGNRIGITGHLQSYCKADKFSNAFNYQIEVYVDGYDFLTPRQPKCIEEESA